MDDDQEMRLAAAATTTAPLVDNAAKTSPGVGAANTDTITGYESLVTELSI